VTKGLRLDIWGFDKVISGVSKGSTILVLKGDDSRGCDFVTQSVGVSWSGAIMGPEELGLLLM
jgi:hypothetical protein